VQQLFKAWFGRKAFPGFPPREVVVQAAALCAWKLKTNPGVFSLRDVCLLPIAIEHPGGLIMPMKKKNEPIPASAWESLVTTRYDQTDKVI
jgi:molecular chaperone DnaK (HSP70)